MSVVEINHLSKQFNGITAVDGISFSVDAGEILVIVGGSGCGKTTTLRCIAGLETPTGGEIYLDGQVIASPDIFVPPEKRGLGMVFQSYALWPHMTVFDNVAYGLTLQKKRKKDIGQTVMATLESVGLADFATRYPGTLSGGQQQRVALARSAVVEPRLLLLDEPLSNLDAKLREQMRDELRRMIKSLNMTAIYITHDQAEAMALADRIICMRAGRIEQIGSGRDIYRRPVNRFVADFIGSAMFFDGSVIEVNKTDGLVHVRIADDITIWSHCSHDAEIGDRVTLGIRPEGVQLRSAEDSPTGILGRIADEIFLGDHTEYLVEMRGIRLRARSVTDFHPDAACTVNIDGDRSFCFPPE